MPIRPELKPLYPPDWRQISRRIRFERAKGRCEQCGAPHLHYRTRGGLIIPPRLLDIFHGAMTFAEAAQLGFRLSRIVLTTAHLDHDPTNNSEENLAALCQRCHLAHDQQHHWHSRRVNRERAVGQERLFER